MKLNYETSLVGKKVILAPYRPEHVLRYHEWMKDPALLEATGSEPLSLDEEIEMQKSWREDELKCTFIVHSTEACVHAEEHSESFHIRDNLGGMVGDVNLFLSEMDDEETEGVESIASLSTRRLQGEIDIMIAEKEFQKRGLGKAATCSMLLYGARRLDIKRFFCKINEDNTPSINLFKKLGFVQCDYAACFKQVELELIKPLDELEKLLDPHGSYQESHCPIEDDE